MMRLWKNVHEKGEYGFELKEARVVVTQLHGGHTSGLMIGYTLRLLHRMKDGPQSYFNFEDIGLGGQVYFQSLS